MLSEEGMSGAELAKYLPGSIWRLKRDTWGDAQPNKIYMDSIAPQLDDTSNWKRLHEGDLIMIVGLRKNELGGILGTVLHNDKVVEIYISKHLSIELIKPAP